MTSRSRPRNPREQRAQASPARRIALGVLRRVDEGAYADRALAAECARARVDPRDRHQAQRLAFGAVQMRRLLDWLIDGVADNPGRIEPGVRDVLRLGAYEIISSDGTPDWAAVDQAVTLARSLPGPRGRGPARAGLVNALLRRIAAEGPARIAALGPDQVALRHSFPDWIAHGLTESLGADDAVGVMAAANTASESAVRWNTLRGPRDAVEAELPLWHGDPLLPEAMVLEQPFALEESQAWREGRVMGQSRASMIPARALIPRPGERVLDMCAAPGAKATQLCALAEGGAEVVGVELHASRARALREQAQRMGADITVIEGDAREVPLPGGPFDAVLVDAPCTGTGVLSSRPDARWRRREEALAPLVEIQQGLLARALEVVRPGGRVVYSTCSLLRQEDEDVVQASGARVDDLSAEFPGMQSPLLPGTLRLLPHVHGTDGFFVARLISR
ncbi:MAG: methyltransferase domain-containing protein [Thermoleophilia bacterium]|nr:methyltransferase domain-containing protein [Thermoleophilia bacterium]